jgi:hypothetical protein
MFPCLLAQFSKSDMQTSKSVDRKVVDGLILWNMAETEFELDSN